MDHLDFLGPDKVTAFCSCSQNSRKQFHAAQWWSI